jgi:outer membrane lipoprotein-sorting protein
MSRWIPLLALALLIAPPAGSQEDAVPVLEVDEVRACMARNLPEKSAVQSVVIKARDRIGSERTLRAKVYWKRMDDGMYRLRADFSEPEEIDGAGFLMIQEESGNQMFLYLPDIRKVRRVNSQMMKGKIFGTDFSYEDFQRIYGVREEGELSRRPDSDLDGINVYVLEAQVPPEANSAYELMRSYVDPRTCVALKTELYERGGDLRKVLVAPPEDVRQEADVWIPGELVMQEVRERTQTSLRVESMRVNEKISDRTFSLSQLERASRR